MGGIYHGESSSKHSTTNTFYSARQAKDKAWILDTTSASIGELPQGPGLVGNDARTSVCGMDAKVRRRETAHPARLLASHRGGQESVYLTFRSQSQQELFLIGRCTQPAHCSDKIETPSLKQFHSQNFDDDITEHMILKSIPSNRQYRKFGGPRDGVLKATNKHPDGRQDTEPE